MWKVIIADDEKLVCRLIEALVDWEKLDMQIVGRAENGLEALQMVEQFQPQNGYTTCMWHNLLTCKVLYDRDGRLTAARARFDVPYPPQLRQNIMENSWRLLHSALPAYEGQIKKALKRGDLVSVSHRTAAFLEAYFDFLFALNGVTHPGEKRLVQLCRERCKLLPRRFEENLERLFQDMFRDPAGTAANLEDILAELKILA